MISKLKNSNPQKIIQLDTSKISKQLPQGCFFKKKNYESTKIETVKTKSNFQVSTEKRVILIKPKCRYSPNHLPRSSIASRSSSQHFPKPLSFKTQSNGSPLKLGIHLKPIHKKEKKLTSQCTQTIQMIGIFFHYKCIKKAKKLVLENEMERLHGTLFHSNRDNNRNIDLKTIEEVTEKPSTCGGRVTASYDYPCVTVYRRRCHSLNIELNTKIKTEEIKIELKKKPKSQPCKTKKDRSNLSPFRIHFSLVEKISRIAKKLKNKQHFEQRHDVQVHGCKETDSLNQAQSIELDQSFLINIQNEQPEKIEDKKYTSGRKSKQTPKQIKHISEEELFEKNLKQKILNPSSVETKKLTVSNGFSLKQNNHIALEKYQRKRRTESSEQKKLTEKSRKKTDIPLTNKCGKLLKIIQSFKQRKSEFSYKSNLKTKNKPNLSKNLILQNPRNKLPKSKKNGMDVIKNSFEISHFENHLRIFRRSKIETSKNKLDTNCSLGFVRSKNSEKVNQSNPTLRQALGLANGLHQSKPSGDLCSQKTVSGSGLQSFNQNGASSSHGLIYSQRFKIKNKSKV